MAVVYGVITVPATRSVLWTAKLIGFELQLRTIDLMRQENRSDHFLKLNPAHSVPTFVDADGLTIWDSHAIVTYLVDQYAADDSLYPKDVKKRAVVDNMLHFNNSCLWASIRGHFCATKVHGKPYDADREALVKDRLNTLNTVLGQRSYAAGEQLTVADLCLLNCISAIKSFGSGETENYPHIVKWQRKLSKEVKYYDEIVAKGTCELAAYWPVASAYNKNKSKNI